MLISLLSNPDGNLQYLMSSDWVQQVGIAKKILVVSLNESDITKLPVVDRANKYISNLSSQTYPATASRTVEHSKSETPSGSHR